LEERTKELNEKLTEIKTHEDHRFVHLLNGQDKVIALVFNVSCRLSRLKKRIESYEQVQRVKKQRQEQFSLIWFDVEVSEVSSYLSCSPQSFLPKPSQSSPSTLRMEVYMTTIGTNLAFLISTTRITLEQ
jgi:hypothetical protein